MNNAKIQSESHENKTLRLKRTMSRFSIPNLKPSKQQQKSGVLFLSHSIPKNHFIIDAITKNQKDQSSEKQNVSQKLSEEVNKNQFVSKSLEINKHRKSLIVLNKNKNIDKHKISLNPPLLKSQSQNSNSKRLSLSAKNEEQKNHVQLFQLLNLCKQKKVNRKLELQSNDSTQNTEIQKPSEPCNRKNIKLDHETINIVQLQEYEKESSETNKKTEKKLVRSYCFNKLTISSNVTSVMISPWMKSGQDQKISCQTQTYQSQPQIYQYLIYKRKKQQYENELKTLFNEVNLIKQDRKQMSQRRDIISLFGKQLALNQRQKRVFELKKDMTQLEQNVQQIIIQKNRNQQIQLKEIQHLQMIILNGLGKFDNLIKTHLNVFKQVFQKLSEDKYMRVLQKLDIITTSFLTQIDKQIQQQIQKSKAFKQQTTDLHYAFSEYMKSNSEYKQLLRNCFNHLKKTPELCYEFFGQNPPKMNTNFDLMNQNKQFQKPKCTHCFNSHWKLHVIVQQNLLMKSILKVSEQLLK